MIGANAFAWAYFGELMPLSTTPVVPGSPGGGGFSAPQPEAFFLRYKPTLRKQKV